MAKPYQVFIGCPFRKAIRKNYDKLKEELERSTPLHVVLADTGAISSTDYLLEHITSLVRESASCVFDATGGNPNVSLEVGIAHALPAEFVLTFYTRKPRIKEQRAAEVALAREGEVKPIIADLQGRLRIEYRTYPALKDQLMRRHLNSLPYMKRWTSFKRNHSSFAKPALELFKEIRTSGRTLRPRVNVILDGTGINTTDFVEALARERLITRKRGREGGYYYPSSVR